MSQGEVKNGESAFGQLRTLAIVSSEMCRKDVNKLPKYITRMLWLKVFSGSCCLANACVLFAMSDSGSFTSVTNNWAGFSLSTLERLFEKLRGTASHPCTDTWVLLDISYS